MTKVRINMTMRPCPPLALISILCVMLVATASAGEHRLRVAELGPLTEAEFKEGTPEAEGLESGDAVVRFNEPFEFRIDLKARGIDPENFDLLKLEVKADPGAIVRVAIENHPRSGDMSYWYVLDGMRGAFDWKTIWVDLRRPEEIKSAGDHRSPWREGIGEDARAQRGVRISGSVQDWKSKQQGEHRRIWIGNVRLVSESVHLDWDQTQAPYTWGEGQDLVYTYPLTISNKCDTTVTARLELEPVEVPSASVTAAPGTVRLDPRESKSVEVRLTLPAAVAAEQDPLYCERFLVTARAEGIEDSAVTILRSSDPIHLTVTVPLAEKNLQFPLLPRPSELPVAVLKFDEGIAREHAAEDPALLIENALRHGLYQYGYAKDTHNVGQYRQTLISAAYLYDITGEQQHLRTAEQLLQALPTIWKKWYAEYEREPVRIVSSGIVARWNERSHYTLGLGWLVMGTQRSPYYYGTSGNGRGGSMGALAYAFDIIAPRLAEDARQEIIQGFFLPAGIQARNHYVGDGNQQMTANVTALYAGLVARNWPLVSLGYSSEHGLMGVLEKSFDDHGVQLRKNYQTYTMRPILWANELLYGAGFNLYAKHEGRLKQIVDADTQAKGQGAAFQDVEFWEFVKRRRLP